MGSLHNSVVNNAVGEWFITQVITQPTFEADERVSKGRRAVGNLLGTSDQGTFVMHQLRGTISKQCSQTFLRASKTVYTMAGSP